MSGLFQDLILAAWGALSLLVALVAFLAKGFKGVFYTVVAMWVIVPVGLFGLRTSFELYARWEMARIQKLYAALCAGSERETIRRTVSGVAEVSIWPSKGPKDGWGNDLFFRTRTGDKWIEGRDGGRYGGFRETLLAPPGPWVAGTPRYQVVFKDLVIKGEPMLRGMRIQVVDKLQNLLLAERVDYVAQWNFGSPRGCDGAKSRVRSFPSDDWFDGNLRFIHAVLNPPAGVVIEARPIPAQYDVTQSKATPEVSATLQEIQVWPGKFESLQKQAPPEIRFMEGHQLPGLRIDFRLQDRDIQVAQNLPRGSEFIAIARLEGEYAALIWANETRAFVMRHFDLDGQFIGQEVARWPDGIVDVSTMLNPSKKITVEPAQFGFVVIVNLHSTSKPRRVFNVTIPRLINTKSHAVRDREGPRVQTTNQASPAGK